MVRLGRYSGGSRTPACPGNARGRRPATRCYARCSRAALRAASVRESGRRRHSPRTYPKRRWRCALGTRSSRVARRRAYSGAPACGKSRLRPEVAPTASWSARAAADPPPPPPTRSLARSPRPWLPTPRHSPSEVRPLPSPEMYPLAAPRTPTPPPPARRIRAKHPLTFLPPIVSPGSAPGKHHAPNSVMTVALSVLLLCSASHERRAVRRRRSRRLATSAPLGAAPKLGWGPCPSAHAFARMEDPLRDGNCNSGLVHMCIDQASAANSATAAAATATAALGQAADPAADPAPRRRRRRCRRRRRRIPRAAAAPPPPWPRRIRTGWIPSSRPASCPARTR